MKTTANRIIFAAILSLFLVPLSNSALAQDCDTLIVTQDTTEISREPLTIFVVNTRYTDRSICAVNVQVSESGYYKLFAETWNDFDEPNESYYLTVEYPDSSEAPLCDPNLAQWKIVPDTTGVHPSGLRYAGLFFLEAGINEIILNHYAILANLYPKFWVGPSDSASILAQGNSVHMTRIALEKATDRYDLTLAYSALTDTSVEINGNQEQSAPIGGTYSYNLNIVNQGANTANDVLLWLVPPDSVNLFDFNIAQDDSSADTLFWRFDQITPSQEIDITFQAQVSDSLQTSPFELFSESTIEAGCDTNQNDNSDSVSVFAIEPLDYFGADVSLTQAAHTDTSVEINGQTERAVVLGGNYSYEVNVSNLGPNDAGEVILEIVPPDSVQLVNFDLPPDSASGDTLLWTINNLIASQQTDITFQAEVADSLPASPFQLVLESKVTYQYDSDSTNNAAQDTVFAIDPFNYFGADISITQSAQTDTTVDIGGQFEPAEFIGGTYPYELNVTNQGPNTAGQVMLWLVPPDSVRLFDFSIQSDSASGDTLFWTFSGVTPSQQIDITFLAELADTVPATPFLLLLESYVDYLYDTNPANNSDQNMVYAVDPFDYFGADITITQSAQTDTSVEIGGQLEQGEFIGGTYSYEINVTNQGPNTANDVLVWLVRPDSVSLSNFSLQPDTTAGDTLFWTFSEITPSEQIDIAFQAEVADSFPFAPFQLLLEGNVDYLYDTDPDNNSDQNMVYAIDPFDYFGADITITQFAQTDTSVEIGGQLEQVEYAGGTYSYQLQAANQGPNKADNVTLWVVPPDSVRLFDFNLPPDSTSGDTLFWEFGQMTPSQQIDITFQAELASSLPSSPFQLLLESNIDYLYDFNPGNNSAENMVFAIDPFDYFRADIAITQSVQTDTIVEIGGQLDQAEFLGGIFSYELNVSNQGPNTAQNVVLWLLLPDAVGFLNSNVQPYSISGDTLFWRFDIIVPFQQIDIMLQVEMADSLPVTPVQLLSISRVDHLWDDNPVNNFAYAILYAIDPFDYFGADIAITQSAQTDTSVEIDGQLEQAELIGGTFSYEVTLINQGPNSANDVELWLVPPDSVRLFDFTIQPESTSGDTLFWTFNEITPSQQIDITFQAEVVDSLPTTQFPLVSEISVDYKYDTDPANNSATATVFAINPFSYFGTDLVFTQIARTDTTLEIDGNLEQVEPIGDIYIYELRLENQGPNIARDVILWIIPPDSVRLTNFNIPPASSSGDTLFWFFSEIAVNQQIDITFLAEVADDLPTTPFELVLESKVIYLYDTDTTNNAKQNTVFVLDPIDYLGADISLTQSAQTDTTIEINGQAEQAVAIGQVYSYELNVINHGPNIAESVLLWFVRPDYVQLFSFNIQPNTTSGDTLFWTFNKLIPSERIDITFQAQLADSLPSTPFQLFLESTVEYQFDNNSSNNSAQGLVYAFNPCDFFVQDFPRIEVAESQVEVGDSVRIRVWLPSGVVNWEIWVRYVDGSVDRNFADSFIASTPITPQQWIDIEPLFQDTRLITSAENEDIFFEIRTTDVCGNSESAQASITVQSSDDCLLDRNVFQPESATPLGIRFKLSTNRNARVDLYDVTGYHVTKIVQGPFNAGWNTHEWNGRTEDGQPVGSGVYIITIRSGILDCVLKVIIVR